MKFPALILSLVVALAGVDAFAAKRMGGGRSVGQQSSNVAQRDAAPKQQQSNDATAPGAANAAPKPGTAGAPPAKRPWGAMLGGLAAGLGLAWLASSLGLGAGFGEFLLYALLAFAAFAAFRWFMRSKAPAPGNANSPLAFQGANAASPQISAPPVYRPENVGNDASARPWERNSMAFEVSKNSGSIIGSSLAGSQSWGVPAGFDTDGFLKAAKTNFVTLQAAWDRSDIATLRSMMTDTMLLEIQAQLTERETQATGSSNLTDVVMVDARLLGIEELPTEYMASVEFSGMIREDSSAGPNPFREVWNMTKAKTGSSGWLVAGVQALQ
jgi:predicted lipid-binding transport protein (Tim44 family)